jgi:hypothetical protein
VTAMSFSLRGQLSFVRRHLTCQGPPDMWSCQLESTSRPACRSAAGVVMLWVTVMGQLVASSVGDVEVVLPPFAIKRFLPARPDGVVVLAELSFKALGEVRGVLRHNFHSPSPKLIS